MSLQPMKIVVSFSLMDYRRYATIFSCQILLSNEWKIDGERGTATRLTFYCHISLVRLDDYS